MADRGLTNLKIETTQRGHHAPDRCARPLRKQRVVRSISSSGSLPHSPRHAPRRATTERLSWSTELTR